MDKIEIKLSEYPVCGREAKFVNSGITVINSSIRVECDACKATMGSVLISADYCAKEVAAKAWNSRTEMAKCIHSQGLKYCGCCGQRVAEQTKGSENIDEANSY